MRVSGSTIRGLLAGWLVLVALALGVTAAMAASDAWRAIAAHAPVAVRPVAAAGYEAEDHFPGAALLYAADQAVAPLMATPVATPGTTGTIALPPLPVSIATATALSMAEVGVTPAQPFSLSRASPLDLARATQCLTDAIYYEAASEPDAGQRAVAQVILNRARHPAFPGTVCGVVYQGSERAGCQFSFACDGAMARVPSRLAWARAARVAAAALAGYVYAPVGLATHYHTYAVTPAWNRSLVMTDVVGAHFFHRWKGYWGTAAAFTQGYRGGEPTPGPHARITPLIGPAVIAALPLPMQPIAAAATPPLAIQPSYRQSSIAVAAPQSDDHLPPASTVLDRWKDSGKPAVAIPASAASSSR